MTVIDSRGGIWSHTVELGSGDMAETKLHIEAGPATIMVSTTTEARVRIRDESDGSVMTLYVEKPVGQVGAIVGSGTYRVQAVNRGGHAADVHFMCGYGEGAKGQPEPLV